MTESNYKNKLVPEEELEMDILVHQALTKALEKSVKEWQRKRETEKSTAEPNENPEG